MISIDKAKQLKELGLKWNPKCGDWYKADYWPTPTLFTTDTLRLDDKEIENVIKNVKNNIFINRIHYCCFIYIIHQFYCITKIISYIFVSYFSNPLFR